MASAQVRANFRSAASTSVEIELENVVIYPCPQCHAPLEVAGHLTESWVRCPKCGQPSLPPTNDRLFAPNRPAGQEIVFLGENGAIEPAMFLKRPKQSPQFSLGRSVCLFFLLCGGCALLSGLFNQDMVQISLGGMTTIVFLGLLAIPPKRS
jgi:predicted RNA-binding Zn-ribbon protein involved in translation (DUF1610 family)